MITANVETRQSPKQNCPVTHPCADRAIVTSLSASRLPPVRPAQCGCRPCSMHSAVCCSAIPPLPGYGCHRPGGSAPIPPRCVPACPVPAAVEVAGSCLATVTGVMPVATHPVVSAPWYGCRHCPPGRCHRGRRHGPHRHPSSIPFNRCCPYPFHPCQVLDPEERSVLSPVRHDRLGLLGPHVRQSLLQRRRICRIDVDAVGRRSGSGQQQCQSKRLPRKPRPHRVAPCDVGPTAAGIPSEQSVSLATYTQPIVHITFTQPAKYLTWCREIPTPCSGVEWRDQPHAFGVPDGQRQARPIRQ